MSTVFFDKKTVDKYDFFHTNQIETGSIVYTGIYTTVITSFTSLNCLEAVFNVGLKLHSKNICHFSKIARFSYQNPWYCETQCFLGCRPEEVKSHVFFKDVDWQQVFLRRLQPPLVPPRGEVNAADAFDIGNFDEDDVKGIKVRGINFLVFDGKFN